MDVDLSKALADLALALMSVAILLVTRVVIPWIESRTSASTVETARNLALQVALAVEQIGGVSDWTSQEKLDDATTRLRMLADRHGIKLNDTQVRTLIEQAVLEMNQVVKAPPKPKTTRRRATPVAEGA